MSLPAELQESLTRVAEEYSQSAPPEVYRVFPAWRHELKRILSSHTAEQLQSAVEGLNAEANKSGSGFSPYHFARHALNAALDVHEAWGRRGAVGAAAATVTVGFLAEAAARSIVVDQSIQPELVSRLLAEGWQLSCQPPEGAEGLTAIDTKTESPELVSRLLSEGWQMVCEPPSEPKSRAPVMAQPVRRPSQPKATSLVGVIVAEAPPAVREAFPSAPHASQPRECPGRHA